MEPEIKIDEKDPVYKLLEIYGDLVYTALHVTYLRHWRKIAPRTMFELLVFVYGSRYEVDYYALQSHAS